MQNGVDNVERIRSHVRNETLAGVIYTGVEMSGPGRLTHTGGGKVVLGHLRNKADTHQQELVKNVRRGDIVITTGGLIGKVTKAVDDAEVEVEIAPNVKVRLLRAMISDVRAKGEPVKEAS